MKKLISLAVVISAMAVATVQAQNTNSNRVTVNWTDPSRPGLVKVEIFMGGISVKTHAGRDVIVSGGQVGRSRPPETTSDGLRRIDTGSKGFTLEEANNVLTISNFNWINGGGNLEIEVPVKTNLTLSTINGNAIVVEGVDGEIEVTNTNGDIRLTNVSGSVVAHAMNGKLSAVLREVASGKALSFSSMNSNVDVTLPPTTKASLKVRADNGEFYSDFDVQQSRVAAPPVVEDTRNRGRNGRYRVEVDRTANYTINGGGTDIEIRTFNGNISLRKAK